MPIYEYRCEKCGVLEIIHSINDKAERCPHCHAPITKLISAGSFVMDGKMQSSSPNSPDGLHVGNELRRKHTRAGTLPDWRKENMEKIKRDGKFSY